jgi:hypothetical protein
MQRRLTPAGVGGIAFKSHDGSDAGRLLLVSSGALQLSLPIPSAGGIAGHVRS